MMGLSHFRSGLGKLGVLGWSFASLLACGAPPSPPGTSTQPESQVDSTLNDDILATFDGGTVTWQELDATILAMPAPQRQQLNLDGPDAYPNLVRELAMDKVLLAEAQLQGIDQAPEIQTNLRALKRNILVQQYLSQNMPDIAKPTEAEIAAEFERRREEYQRPERRLVYNLFRRLEPGTSKETLKEEVQGLRQQILDGQGFSVLAARHSDSESRHQSGELGWFQPGQLSPDLDRVLFSLDEGVPSQPIATRDGVHLFMVDVIVEAKHFTLDEVRSKLTQELQQQHRDDAMADVEAQLDIDVDVFKPEDEELTAILQRQDPNEVVLRVGDYELRLGTFIAMLENDVAQRPISTSNRAADVLRQVWRGELIYQQQLAAGVELSEDELQDVIQQRDQLLTFQGRQQKMRQRLEQDAAALREFFEGNRMRFTSPLKLELRRLSIPLGERPSDLMALLERRREDLDTGEATLEELASQLDGQIDDLGWLSLAQLQAADSRLAALSSEVDAGHHTPPSSTPEALQVLHVIDRQEPSPLPYEQVRARVLQAYLERHGQQLYRDLRSEMLSAVGFRLEGERLESLLASGLAQKESLQ